MAALAHSSPSSTAPGACGSFVMKHVSSTEDHPGWVYYRCPGHGNGCNLWHWEMGYVAFLVKKKFLTRANVVDAIGWSEERREELERRNEHRRARAGFIRGPCSEERMNASLLQVGRSCNYEEADFVTVISSSEMMLTVISRR
ncbi:coatomer subunit gamma-2 [Hordeum vulgare]|nr:coatomer subunit gamma-2 [Hordeum vulgare]